MQERRLKITRRGPPPAAEALAAALGAGRRRRPPRVSASLLAALTAEIERIAETGGPALEATGDAARGVDPIRERERLAVALANLDAALTRGHAAVRAVLEDLERGRPRASGRK